MSGKGSLHVQIEPSFSPIRHCQNTLLRPQGVVKWAAYLSKKVCCCLMEHDEQHKIGVGDAHEVCEAVTVIEAVQHRQVGHKQHRADQCQHISACTVWQQIARHKSRRAAEGCKHTGMTSMTTLTPESPSMWPTGHPEYLLHKALQRTAHYML